MTKVLSLLFHQGSYSVSWAVKHSRTRVLYITAQYGPRRVKRIEVYRDKTHMDVHLRDPKLGDSTAHRVDLLYSILLERLLESESEFSWYRSSPRSSPGCWTSVGEMNNERMPTKLSRRWIGDEIIHGQSVVTELISARCGNLHIPVSIRPSAWCARNLNGYGQPLFLSLLHEHGRYSYIPTLKLGATLQPSNSLTLQPSYVDPSINYTYSWTIY